MNLTKRQRSDLVDSLRAGATALEDLVAACHGEGGNSPYSERRAAQAKRLRRYADTFEKGDGP